MHAYQVQRCREPVTALCHHRWPPFPNVCSLFKHISQLQHAEVILLPPDDLHPTGKPFGAKPAGTEMASSDNRDVITGLHPADGKNEELVRCHETSHAVIELGALAFRSSNLWPGWLH